MPTHRVFQMGSSTTEPRPERCNTGSEFMGCAGFCSKCGPPLPFSGNGPPEPVSLCSSRVRVFPGSNPLSAKIDFPVWLAGGLTPAFPDYQRRLPTLSLPRICEGCAAHSSQMPSAGSRWLTFSANPPPGFAPLLHCPRKNCPQPLLLLRAGGGTHFSSPGIDVFPRRKSCRASRYNELLST
jgi:hypothetical protein